VAQTVRPIRSSRRRLLLWLILAVAAVAVIFGAISGFYIDILWFREVGLSSVFWTRFWSRAILAVVFGTAFFVLLYVNLLIVRRLRPRYRVFSPEEEIVERYRAAFEPYARWVLPGVSLLFAAFAAAGVASQWESYQLWRVSGDIPFGTLDPIFGRDVAFYLLSLPFQRFVQGWLFTSLVVIALVTAAAHYLWGGIRLRVATERFSPQVKAHLSVLLGVIVLVRAWGYRLGQFDLLTSERGVVTGASYTDVNAHLPALRLLVVIAIVCAVLFLVNIRFRGWALPALSIGLLALASVVVGAIYPAFVQRFRVAPQELQRERPYIERNIEFTRTAYGIDAVGMQEFPAEPTFSAEEVEASPETIENIRLWNPDVIKKSYLQLQRLRPFYEFEDVDVDRYVVDGARRTVMIAPREIDQLGIPGGGATWQNQHLFYTHGYGVTASRVDEVTPEGAPSFIVSDIPPTGPLAPELQEPRIYFEEGAEVPYVAVSTQAQEFDFPLGQEGGQELTRYEGRGGIQVGGFFRRLAFAWRYRDVNLLISGLIDENSRMLINLDLPSRVSKIAPFLQYDQDPYAAVVDGRVVWIWDAYTTSDRFPYSELSDMSTLTAQVTESGALEGNDNLPTDANYIRNSVKVAIDAYDGTPTFYVVDDEDPLIRAWGRVFPDLFTPVSQAPLSLQEHFRYPEDLFRIQTDAYANYHVTDPVQFYAKGDFWSIPQVSIDPTVGAVPLEPYYLLLPLPGEEVTRFILFTPFTPANRPNMVAWMAANSDPEEYGVLTSFQFGGRNVIGPGQAAVLMHQDPDVSRETSLLDQRGSNVIYGDLLVIPVGRGFVYVQPLYLESEQAGQGIPEMKRVVVVNGQDVLMRNTLGEALAAAVGAAPPTEEPAEPGEPTEPAGDVAALLAQAEQHFEAAEAALQAGDLATYEAEIDAARRLIQQAAELTGATPAPEGSPEPSPSPGG
jgi:uncharacterized membrane protein (UPF0182 family)